MMNRSASTACDACAPDTFQANLGSPACDDCPPGMVQPATRQIGCVPAPGLEPARGIAHRDLHPMARLGDGAPPHQDVDLQSHGEGALRAGAQRMTTKRFWSLRVLDSIRYM